jgi:hypothetical protein
LILETSFMIDLEREVARAAPGPVPAFLEEHVEDSLYVTVAGELAIGGSLSQA